MKLVPFEKSSPCSLGVELELQLINPTSGEHVSVAKDIIRNVEGKKYAKVIKPEVTQSMIEINSNIHPNPDSLLKEFNSIKKFLTTKAKSLKISIAGGGTHPFERWETEKIFPSARFKKLNEQFRYLTKTSTVFGMHIHIGCESKETCIYLCHALVRYVPQLIALSAASPFYQGVDTGFDSTRSNIFALYPSSGAMPFLETWKDFSDYFYMFKKLGIVESMKDLYWDIRPKPEFGTVECRVCDCPLTIQKVIQIAAYFQCLCHYLIEKQPALDSKGLYQLYKYNRFQGIRYGLKGIIIDPASLRRTIIEEDILKTIKKIKQYAKYYDSQLYIEDIEKSVLSKKNDATHMREYYKKTLSLIELMNEMCQLWEKI